MRCSRAEQIDQHRGGGAADAERDDRPAQRIEIGGEASGHGDAGTEGEDPPAKQKADQLRQPREHGVQRRPGGGADQDTSDDDERGGREPAASRAVGLKYTVPSMPDSATAPARSLSVIIPAYNESENILATLENVTRAFEPLTCPHEILVIDDGSRDTTAAPGHVEPRSLSRTCGC